MKVDRSKLKKSSSEVPADCKVIIDAIKGLTNNELLNKLKDIKTWSFGKCELYHWADILDIFDSILEKACQKESDKKWTLFCDLPGNEELKNLLLEVLRFTALLIEHSFSRHLYSSMDHLSMLLTSCDMNAVLHVLNLLYVFSKRSNFISRMSPEKKQGLIQRLVHLAESWGGKENGFGLAECCQDLPKESYPSSATTLHFEFYAENKDDKNKKMQIPSTLIQSIHMDNVDKNGMMPSQIMEEIITNYNVPQEKQIVLFTHVRLACLFSNYEARVHCVQARLQAISILVYSVAIQENMNVILYPGLIEELVDIVEIKGPVLVDIKSAALRTLTSVIHIERNPRLTSIIDATGASSYHGFLPVLVRTCIQHMIDPLLTPFPQTYATSLFSFLYHLASYDNGVEALVSCGMMESLLKVINWYGDGQEHITFVTRAVRVIDLITNMDMAAFQGLGGLQAFINRLEHEVNLCREDQPFEILIPNSDGSMDTSVTSPMDMTSSQAGGELVGDLASAWQPKVVEEEAQGTISTNLTELPSTSENKDDANIADPGDKKNKHCFAQRAALLKSMLNFMKKAIPDLSFADSIRHLMDGSLPKSLKHIISNAEYYGPSLFLLATDVVTVYVFQEPSLLSSLQDKGLTDVVLHALLVKDVPATREVLASLPNVFSALCLNARGLEAFVACKPFDRLFKVLLSPDYLPAMRRRRSSDPFGDTASNLGNAMDELMRHQPSLRTDATKAIIKLLEEICSMGQDPHYICQKQPPKTDPSSALSSVRSPQSNEASSSDEDDEEEVEMPHMPSSISAPTHLGTAQNKPSSSTQESMQVTERQAIPLMDYVLNVMKFVEAILSNNSTDDHCREFVLHKGLKPLMSILGLPNLPIDFPSSAACQAVSSVCKSVLTLSREPQVLKQGLLQMNEVLHQLRPLHQPLDPPGGSVLLRELANCTHITDATLSATATPLLHSLANAHAYIMMFVHVCRMGQTDIRTISINHWGSDLGLEVLKGLSSLYNSLVWESTVLLALCNEDYLPPDCQFGRADLDKLLSKDAREKIEAEGELQEDKSSPGAMNDQDSPLHQSTVTSAGTSSAAVPMDTQQMPGEECMDTSEVSTSQQPHSTGVQSLNVPFTGVSNSMSSTSIDSDNAGNAGASSSDKDPKKKVSPAMQAQLRQLKPLLTLSSRLGRALSELFVLLVKLSVGTPVRQRRSQPSPTPAAPSPAARDVALALTKLLAGGLSFQPPAYSPQPKLRMTFLVCSAGFTAPMLFDEKKQPYHLMLQKFVACGGQAALFQSFSWALSMDGRVPLNEGLEHSDLPEGTGEFLDSWLNLVEKMINPKSVLESPHTLPPPKGKPSDDILFKPVQYLVSTQKAAFNAVMNLWDKTPLAVHGGRIAESVLAILCHIVCGESILKKHLDKDKTAGASGTGDIAVDLSRSPGPSGLVPFNSFLLDQELRQTSGGSSNISNAAPSGGTGVADLSLADGSLCIRVNLSHLNQLMDMGFTREQASIALQNTSGLEQATEYILTHPIPDFDWTAGGSGSAGNSGGGGGGGNGAGGNASVGSMDVEMDEEGQIMKAIAMSLGENAVMSTDQPKDKKPGSETEEKQEDEEPLDTAILDNFTQNIFPGCLKLLDNLPETVYRVCDLIVVIMFRNGKKWKEDILDSLCNDISELCKEMTTGANEQNLNKIVESPSALKFSARLHLLSLLAEEKHQCVAVAMQKAKLPGLMTSLLVAGKTALQMATQTATDSNVTPKWLAPLLLLLDMWEKISVIIKRKVKARIVVGSNRVWKWFDDHNGRWCKYSTSNNNTIDEAFKKGESMIRFQAGRRKYSVQFGTMIQLNEETGNRRPVMLSVSTAEERPQGKKDKTKDDSQQEQVAEEVHKEFGIPGDIDNFLPGFTPEAIQVIISALSGYLSIPLSPDCLHATMRLILRLTRQHEYAEQFVSEGGAQRLLSLTEESNFQGFLNLATLIFRHILDEPVSLRYCMEKVMRNVCAGIGSCRSGVSQGGVGAKEMHYIMRVLAPAACRNPKLFSQVAKDTLQITLPPAAGKDNDDSRNIMHNLPQLLKCNPTKQLESLANPWIKNFIWDLLNALVIHNKESEASNASSAKAADNKEASKSVGEIPDVLEGILTNQEPSQSSSKPSTGNTDKEKDGSSKSADGQTSSVTKQLIPKSAILRLLSEIIRSYGNCVQLITQHTYQAGQSDLVSEACSVLAFVLDNLLSSSQVIGDDDCPMLSRVFIASIASCSLSPDAQMTLVTEVKGALQRAVALPESSSKHQRVQALANIISTMIESCHSPGTLPNHFFKGQQVINNNMMKILVKKGMLIDLARIPHSLDLSSPFLATTINCVLKPLVTLSQSVNSPDKLIPPKKAGDHGTVPDQGGTTTQIVSEPAPQENNEENELNQAAATEESSQMNLTIEDVTNNLEAQNNLEVTTEHRIAEPEALNQERGEFDDLLEQLWERNTGADPESQVLSEMTISQVGGESTAVDDHEILIDVEVEGDDDDYDNEHHDSQMVSQVLSDEDDADDGDNDRDPDNQDDVSADDDDYDEGDQEEMGEDDEEEDEEDEEDEDDEETSDMEGDGDGDGYQEIRNPFDTDDMILHMEDFPTRGRMANMPPAPSMITSTHPLLTRQPDGNQSRAHRSGRSRLRSMPAAQVNLLTGGRANSTPIILQRLLGPSTAAEILHLTTTLGNNMPGGAGPSRLVVAGDNLPFLQRAEEDSFIEEIFQDADDTSGVLSCIPSTLIRWTEETKVLDGEGAHDLVTILKPSIIEELVQKRDEELEERKEKRKKTEPANSDSKKKDKPESSTETAPLTSSGEGDDAVPPVSSESAATSAEMFVSAIVEQALSPLVSTRNSSQTTTAATSAMATTIPAANAAAASTIATSAASPAASPASQSFFSLFMQQQRQQQRLLNDSASSSPSYLSSFPVSLLGQQPPTIPSPDQSMAMITCRRRRPSPSPMIFNNHTVPPQPTNPSSTLWPTNFHQQAPLSTVLSSLPPSSSSTSTFSLAPGSQLNPTPIAMDTAWEGNTTTTTTTTTIINPTATTTSSPRTTMITAESVSNALTAASFLNDLSHVHQRNNIPVTTQSPMTTVTSQHQSLISQLLDGIVVPNPSSTIISSTVVNPGQSVFTSASDTTWPTTITTHSMATNLASIAGARQGSQTSEANQSNMCWSFMNQLGFSVASCQPTTTTGNVQTVASQSQPTSVVTMTGLTSTAAQLPMDTSSPLGNPSSRFDSLTSSHQDLDFSMLFALPPFGRSGVSGATPQMSNLSFGNAPLSDDVQSSMSLTSDGNVSSAGTGTTDADRLVPSLPLFGRSGVSGATPQMSNLSFANIVPSESVDDNVEGRSSLTVTSNGATGQVGVASITAASLVNSDRLAASSSSTDPELPEGVDPSFLAALPDHIRQEVISEQLRLQRIRRRAEEQAQASVSIANAGPSGESSNAMEVNPEFLAALPPSIQEEVLAQQRAEQARLMAQQNSTTNPDLPVDPASFFSTLPSSLRQQVLADMDDSMLAVLPPELLTEAQELRRNMEERHRRRMQEPSIIGFLRDVGLARRLGTRYAITAAQRQNQLPFNIRGGAGASNQNKIKGRFMLDPEALTCLLVLLFIDDPKLNTARLHKVLRNLCYHGPTRSWLIRALISIIQRAGDTSSTSALAALTGTEDRSNSSASKEKGKGKKSTWTSSSSIGGSAQQSHSSQSSSSSSLMSSMSSSLPPPTNDFASASVTNVPMQMETLSNTHTPSSNNLQRPLSTSSGYWLSISLEAALGCRANVFHIQRALGKKQSSSSAVVSIHPQASPVVCRHTLDTLISLAKVFPSHFLPVNSKSKDAMGMRSEGSASGKKDEENVSATTEVPKKVSQTGSLSATSSGRDGKPAENDFWNILVRLDNASGKSKGKGVQRCHSLGASDGEGSLVDYRSSALGQLMGMLSHPVVRRSQLLTDRLLRLLGLISVSLPDSCRPASSTIAPQSVTTTATIPSMVNRPITTNTINSITSATTTTTTAITTAVSAMSATASQPQTGSDSCGSEPVAMVTATSQQITEGSKPASDNTRVKAEEEEEVEDSKPILHEELRLAVEVLTSKSCSEEGLEDATNLLLQLSWANAATRAAVLNLLLSGARHLGLIVCGHIQELLEQLKQLNGPPEVNDLIESGASGSSSKEDGASSSKVSKGVMADRFSSGASVVVSAPSSIKTGRELHLPSMSQLTSKSSSQHFLLRILKVIIQLRDAARTAGLNMKGRRGSNITQTLDQYIDRILDDGNSFSLPVLPAAMGPLNSTSADQTRGDNSNVTQSSQSEESAMEVDAGPGPSKPDSKPSGNRFALPRLSDQLSLDKLWDILGECLAELARTPDHHAVLILQPAVEAFFIVHAGEKMNKLLDQPSSRREDQLAHLNLEMAPPSPAMAGAPDVVTGVSRDSSGASVAVTHLPADTQKFLKFAETHRTVLNQILRQSTLPLSDGPFSVLVDHMRILDFDVKRRYFRQELDRLNEGVRREDLPVHLRRSHVFEDSFRELFRRTPEEWKQRFYICFEGEEGQDAGGLLREWYIIISHEIFNQNYALFRTSPGDRVTYTISPSSHCNSNHLSYFKFVGRIIAKAVYDNKLLDCYFTRSFYKHMLGLAVKYTDMESEDYAFYQGLHFLLENSVSDLGYDLFFSTEVQEFGVTETRELMPDGSNILVNEDNKREYVKRVCQMKMTGAIRQQLNAFLEGFYDIIPKKLVSIFTEQELELLISGLPTIDIDDLKANTEYIKYQATSLQIQWFWRALRSFDQAERANFLQFVTGTSKVPLGGFANLEGMNGTQKFQIHRDDRSTDRLPSAHTCFNQLDLPAYETYDKLRKMLLLAVIECSEGFGLA